MLLMTSNVVSQPLYRNDTVNDIKILKFLYATDPLNVACTHIVYKNIQEENLIYMYDYRMGKILDSRNRKLCIMEELDSLNGVNLLNQLCVMKRIPTSNEIGISQNNISSIKHFCYKKSIGGSRNDEKLFFSQYGSGLSFDSIMLKTFYNFDTCSLLVLSSRNHYCEGFKIVINTYNRCYSFIIYDDFFPLSPIMCIEEQIDWKNLNFKSEKKTYSILNYSIQKVLGELFPKNFKPLYKKIQEKNLLLYKSLLMLQMSGDIVPYTAWWEI